MTDNKKDNNKVSTTNGSIMGNPFMLVPCLAFTAVNDKDQVIHFDEKAMNLFGIVKDSSTTKPIPVSALRGDAENGTVSFKFKLVPALAFAAVDAEGKSFP